MTKQVSLVVVLCAVAAGASAALLQRVPSSEPNEVVALADGVFFRHGELDAKGHCNNGFVIFDDFVLVVDANFPDGAEACIEDIRARTDKPVRFVFDTHHHGDHAYGNATWMRHGALPVAHENVVTELEKYEPERWRGTDRDDVRALGAAGPAPPVLTFPRRMVIESGARRVELLHFGTAHTRGDGFAYLPRERILFTGDAVVNGPYNYMGDGHTESWLRVLEALATLDVAVVAPGHGPCGDASLIADQRAYIASLRAAVAAGIAAGRPLDELERTIEIEERLARYVGSQFEAQVEKIHAEMVGLEMPLELEELGFREAPAIAAGEGRPAPKKLVFSGDPAQVADLERVAGDLEIVLARDNAAVLREVADADALIGRISAEAIRRGTKLRWVHSVSAGVEPYVGIGAPATPGIEELIDSETILTNGQRCYGVAIADQALSYLLALVRQLPTSIAGQRAPAEGTSRWRSVDPGARQEGELRGRTLLVVGVGGIGSQVARRAEAFGMQVLGIDPALDRERPGVDELKGPEALHEFLPRADVVVISCPLTRDTHNLIGARELALLPDGALLINVARGRIVDPAALVDALTSGKLGGAGLDVTEPEPLLDSSPLWDMENVIITPHNAGHADGSRRRVALLIRENVRRFARGLPLLSVVDKKKGY